MHDKISITQIPVFHNMVPLSTYASLSCIGTVYQYVYSMISYIAMRQTTSYSSLLAALISRISNHDHVLTCIIG